MDEANPSYAACLAADMATAPMIYTQLFWEGGISAPSRQARFVIFELVACVAPHADAYHPLWDTALRPAVIGATLRLMLVTSSFAGPK
jgi:hypothetical protein